MGPILRTWRSCSMKSSSVSVPPRILPSIALALSTSTVCWAFSIRLRTSPIPRIREAMRSG